jgi:hypothetical protein
MAVPAAILAACALALAAGPVGATPSRYRVDGTLRRGQAVSLLVGPIPRGEFAVTLRAASDDRKAVRVTQRRAGGRAFTVIDTASPPAGACHGAAGTLVCSGLTTPATPGGRTWRFVVRSRGPRPTSVTLTVVWRRVRSAG